MADIPRIYIDSCPLIDMAKYKANLVLNDDPTVNADRQRSVWFCKKILEAGRNGDVLVFASSMSIVECTQLLPGVPVPPQETQEFFNMLLCSGRSGLRLQQTTESISVIARNLKWRGTVNLKPLDSIHIATAIHTDCGELLTTDARILESSPQLAHPKLKIIQPFQTKLLPERYLQDEMDALGLAGR